MDDMTRRRFVELSGPAAFGAAVARRAFSDESVPASVRILLKDNWYVQSSTLVDKGGEIFSGGGLDVSGWYKATLPCTVLGALVKHRVYPDPRNGLDCYKIPVTSLKEKSMKRTAWLISILLAALPCAAQVRPPAVPLVTHDPYFSVWSMADRLTDDTTRHWTGKPQPMGSLIRIDGAAHRLIGREPDRIPALEQTSLVVQPTRTIYTFGGAGVRVEMTFLSPLLPHDLDLFSRPVSYIVWDVRSTDGKPHSISIYFDASASLAVNTPEQKVFASRNRVSGMEVLRVGSQEQAILGKAGDDLRIDWGYFLVAAPEAAMVIAQSNESAASFASNGVLPSSDDLDFPRAAAGRRHYSALAITFDLGQVASTPVRRFAALAYDDVFSLEYLYRRLRPYWRRNGPGTEDLIRNAIADFDSILARCERFDRELTAELERVGGRNYAILASLAHRQALAAQKLVVDLDGTPMLFPKENFSNGCTGTVDVIYPAAPQLMLFNTELFKASLTPVLEYVNSGRWRFPFAPHDVGTYPLANGQVYGGGEKTEENQMPVEESANMLIMVDWLARIGDNIRYAEKYWKHLAQWANYLREKGLDPENQLCTDDFAGHLAHNANLSIKATVALGAFADLCKRSGRAEEAAQFRRVAEGFAARWLEMARDGDRYKLTFDRAGTWSQKYNLVWDKLLGLNLFPPLVAKEEIAWYLKKQNRYGLPLDSRKDYTKVDWVLWTATLAEARPDFDRFVAPLVAWLNESPSRVPMTDWYSTVTGRQEGFQARSVVGGLFIKMLADPEASAKWSQAPR